MNPDHNHPKIWSERDPRLWILVRDHADAGASLVSPPRWSFEERGGSGGWPGELEMPTSRDKISLDGEATARAGGRISWGASRKASVDSAPWFSFARSA